MPWQKQRLDYIFSRQVAGFMPVVRVPFLI